MKEPDHPKANNEPTATLPQGMTIRSVYSSARLLWGKTQQREFRRIKPSTTKREIAEFVCKSGAHPDNLVDLDEPLEPQEIVAVIAENPELALRTFAWLIAHSGTDSDKTAFGNTRRKLGRDPRIKTFILAVDRVLEEYGFDPDVHDIECAPLAAALFNRAQEIQQFIAAGLTDWLTSRAEMVDQLLRQYVIANQEAISDAPSIMLRRESPPLSRIFPKNIRLEIYNALAPLRDQIAKRQPTAEDTEPTEEERAEGTEAIQAVTEPLFAILEKSTPILQQQSVVLEQVFQDIINWDSFLTREQILADEPTG